MKKFIFVALLTSISELAFATSPTEALVLSCLKQKAILSSILIRNISPHEIQREDNYVDGFNATYLFQYKQSDVGYAESKDSQALIYKGKLYIFSNAIAIGDNHGIAPSPFTPFLAQWNIIKNKHGKYLCVNFNFDGLGQSGSFQNVHGGYLLNVKTRKLYFSARDISSQK